MKTREMKDKIRNESRPVLLAGFPTKKKNLHKSEKERRFQRDKRDLPPMTPRLPND